MADDQKPKTMDINDLVRELSKSSTSPGTPVPVIPTPAPQAPKPPLPLSKPPMSPPMAGSPIAPSSPISKPSVPVTPTPAPVSPPLPKPVMPQPKFNVPPPPFNQSKPAPMSAPLSPVSGSSAPSPSTTPGVKEYQSSIRTMNEDISRLKQGQKPTGIDVPRKVEQVVPVPQSMSPKPAPPAGGPSQQFKVPSVNLGEAQKTGPLAQSKDFSKPPTAPKAELKTQIYVPQEGQKGGNRDKIFMGIGVVAVLAGFLYWFLILRSPAPEVVIETPTPTPIKTPVQDLSSIFSGLVEVSTADTTYKEHQLTDQKGEFIRLKDAQNQDTLSLILNWLNPPQNVKDNLGNESSALLFVQSEFFDAKGQIKVSDLERRLVLVIEAKDASLLTQATSEWETTIVDGTSNVWNINKSKQKSSTFLDNTYRGISIRYKNFPYADRTIDFSIVPASNGKTYFVITNSREAMLFVIDKLKGF